MKIYTRKGDFGQTSTFKNEAVSKGSRLIELQGSIDEVNSQIGYLRAMILKDGSDHRYQLLINVLLDELRQVQQSLFRIGVDITNKFTSNNIQEKDVKKLEQSIDSMEIKTGKLESFIYLSGHESACYAHVVRSTTRRSERNFVKWIEEIKKENPQFIIPVDYQYMNRLADYMFQVARYLNWFFNVNEEKMSL